MEKDLFGSEIMDIPDTDEQYIKDRDKIAYKSKVKRLKYLAKINPGGLLLSGPYRELQLSFIDGHFLSTIVLSQVFVEKLLYTHYKILGLEKFSKPLDRLLTHAYENKTISDFVIKKVGTLRQIRNPITHYKDFYNEGCLDNLSLKKFTPPQVQIEKDAYASIEITTFIARTDLTRIL